MPRTRRGASGVTAPFSSPDAGVPGGDIAHLPLEQRVAQRLLARFRARGSE